MGLVLIITGGAVVVLKTYMLMRRSPTWMVFEMTLRQQAAVVQAMAGMVFVLLEALERGRVVASLLGGGGGSPPAPSNSGSSGQPSYDVRGLRGLAEVAVRGVVPG